MPNARQGRAAAAPFDYPFDGVYTERSRSAQDELRTGEVAD